MTSRGRQGSRNRPWVSRPKKERDTKDDGNERRSVVGRESRREHVPYSRRGEDVGSAEHQRDAESPRSEAQLTAKAARPHRKHRDAEGDDQDETDGESAHGASLSVSEARCCYGRPRERR